jgi:hypothetical protein
MEKIITTDIVNDLNNTNLSDMNYNSYTKDELSIICTLNHVSEINIILQNLKKEEIEKNNQNKKP